jgi:hypothetical protein
MRTSGTTSQKEGARSREPGSKEQALGKRGTSGEEGREHTQREGAACVCGEEKWRSVILESSVIQTRKRKKRNAPPISQGPSSKFLVSPPVVTFPSYRSHATSLISDHEKRAGDDAPNAPRRRPPARHLLGKLEHTQARRRERAALASLAESEPLTPALRPA